MRKIRLTESDLRDMVSRAVYRIMEETGFSPETLYSAKSKTFDKFRESDPYGPEREKLANQFNLFSDAYLEKRDRDTRSKASVDKRVSDVLRGRRRYQKGRGWVTDTDNR